MSHSCAGYLFSLGTHCKSVAYSVLGPMVFNLENGGNISAYDPHILPYKRWLGLGLWSLGEAVDVLKGCVTTGTWGSLIIYLSMIIKAVKEKSVKKWELKNSIGP